jgi:hypothetical protein
MIKGVLNINTKTRLREGRKTARYREKSLLLGTYYSSVSIPAMLYQVKLFGVWWTKYRLPLYVYDSTEKFIEHFEWKRNRFKNRLPRPA